MILETEAITKSYGNLVAVDDVTWGVEQGQAKAVIGPNGAGKTTFFNMLSSVIEPTSGTIRFDGEEITDLAQHEVAQLGIAKTFQISNIFEELTVWENIQIAAQRTAEPRDKYAMHRTISSLDDVNKRTREVIETVQLTEESETEAANLSHGNKRKLEIGIGLATSPKVILLDEPTAGMSAEETAVMLEFLKNLATDPEITLVITEHDISVILELADVITVLHNGRVLAEGTADEITSHNEVQRVYLSG